MQYLANKRIYIYEYTKELGDPNVDELIKKHCK